MCKALDNIKGAEEVNERMANRIRELEALSEAQAKRIYELQELHKDALDKISSLEEAKDLRSTDDNAVWLAGLEKRISALESMHSLF